MIWGEILDITPKDKWLKLLVAIAGCVVMTIVFVLMFGFEINEDKQQVNIGFINIGGIDEEGWSKAHYEGLKSACDTFGFNLLVRDHIAENSGECPKAIEELVDEDANMIFLASYNYPIESKDLISKYKRIEFAANSSEIHARNMTSYFARMYQGRFLAGALAGMRTKTNVIGYVAAMSNSEVNRGINAFTLGVMRTNPKAKVVVTWTGAWRDDEAEAKGTRKLIEKAKADVITSHVDYTVPCDVADELGVDYIAYNVEPHNKSEHHLTTILCRWDLFYRKILQLYLKDELINVKNFWLGIKQGVVDLSPYSESVTQTQRDKLEELRQELDNDKQIFSGVIYDNHGNLKCREGEAISDNVLLERMNWLVGGVQVVD